VLDEHRLVDVKSVTRALGVSERTIQRLVASGGFPKPVYLMGAKRWRKSVVVAWIEQNTVGANCDGK
jgi:predicted DNA-binding transcriptional regulator AlpA